MASQTVEATPAKSGLKPTISRVLRGSNGANITLLITLLGMLIVFSVLAPYFLTPANLLNIARSISISGVVAIGTTIVLIAGGIDLSISAVMALSGMVAVVGIRAGMPFWIGFSMASAAGIFVGLCNGLIITKLRINPLITTLGVGMIVRGFAYIGSGGNTLTVTASGFPELGRGRFLDVIPYPVIILLIMYIIAHIFLTRNLAGRYVYAIGGNPIACRLAGINIDRWRLFFYALGGLFAGLGGYMLSSLVGAAMGNAALGAELDIIAAVILGGASLAGGEGTIIGTFLGVLILGTLTNGLIMLNVPAFWQMVARGGVLMLALFIDSWRSGGYK